MAGKLCPHRLPEQQGDVRVGAAIAQDVAHGVLVVGEQTVPKCAVGSQSESIAGATKWFRNG